MTYDVVTMTMCVWTCYRSACLPSHWNGRARSSVSWWTLKGADIRRSSTAPSSRWSTDTSVWRTSQSSIASTSRWSENCTGTVTRRHRWDYFRRQRCWKPLTARRCRWRQSTGLNEKSPSRRRRLHWKCSRVTTAALIPTGWWPTTTGTTPSRPWWPPWSYPGRCSCCRARYCVTGTVRRSSESSWSTRERRRQSKTKTRN